jgi:VanZ family protein
LIIFLFSLLFILFVTLSPFNFSPANGVQWLSQGAGLYFNGRGIAYSKQTQEGNAFSCGQAISVEVHIKVRHGNKNDGPREIVSLYDGVESPPLVIGMWGGQVFLYSRFENRPGEKWYNQFRPEKNIHKDEEYYIAAVYGGGKKALYCNGKLVEEQAADFPLTGHDKLCGQIIIGSSPFCRNGWMGEIRGIALYDYALSSSEVLNHYRIFINHGASALANMHGLCGLYDFRAKNGKFVQDVAGLIPPLYIPHAYRPVKKTIMHNPQSDMRIDKGWKIDFILNALLFIPLGMLLVGTFYRRIKRQIVLLLLSCLFCAGISFGIEITQTFIPDRYPSYYDVFANVLGAGIGAIVCITVSIIQIRE